MDLGWSELLVIGVVALVIIGPKELPEMFRTLGRFTAKLRAMAREFSRAMEDAAKESGVQDVAADLKKMTSPKAMGLDAVKSAADKFEKWDPLKGSRPAGTPSAPAAPAAPAAPVPPATPATLTPAPVTAAPLDSAPAAAAHGPNTAALAEKVAGRKAAAAETAAKLRAGAADEAPVKRPGRTRAAATKPADAAPKPAVKAAKPAAPDAAAKPARKPAARKSPAGSATPGPTE